MARGSGGDPSAWECVALLELGDWAEAFGKAFERSRKHK